MPDLKIKYTIADLAEAPEPLRMFYQEQSDGTFSLALDGSHPAESKLAEFRTSNRGLNGKVSQLETDVASLTTANGELTAKLATFEGVDPVEYRALKSSDAAGKLSAVEQQLIAEKAAHAKTALRNDVVLEFFKCGGQETAIDYAVVMAEKVFAIRDGALTTDADSPTRPGQKLTLSEWMIGQQGTSPFLFKPSKGGGANNSNNGGIRPADARPVVDRDDPEGFGQNLAGIAAGRVVVR